MILVLNVRDELVSLVLETLATLKVDATLEADTAEDGPCGDCPACDALNARHTWN